MANRNDDFLTLVKSVLDNPEGHRLLKYLKETYVDPSPMPASGTVDSSRLSYLIGQSDLVKGVINALECPEKLKEVKTVEYTDIYNT